MSVAFSEAEVHWREFLDSLIHHSLRGVKWIVADAHAGLNAARRATLPNVPWQRCQFHLQQNAQSYVTRLEQKNRSLSAFAQYSMRQTVPRQIDS